VIAEGVKVEWTMADVHSVVRDQDKPDSVSFDTIYSGDGSASRWIIDTKAPYDRQLAYRVIRSGTTAAECFITRPSTPGAASPPDREKLGNRLEDAGVALGDVQGDTSPVMLELPDSDSYLLMGLSDEQVLALNETIVDQFETPGGITVYVVSKDSVGQVQPGEFREINGVPLLVLEPAKLPDLGGPLRAP
jgi:hypothetical protein